MESARNTTRRVLATILPSLLLVAVPALANPGPSGALETIAPGAALAEIQGSHGVVLLDVYAEW